MVGSGGVRGSITEENDNNDWNKCQTDAIVISIALDWNRTIDRRCAKQTRLEWKQYIGAAVYRSLQTREVD